MLTRLRYVSTLSEKATPEDLASIVAWAATWNTKHGIAGILAVEGRQVMQVLEGSAEVIDALFLGISADPRHYGIVVLDRYEISASGFGDWGMVVKPMVAMLLTIDGW